MLGNLLSGGKIANPSACPYKQPANQHDETDAPPLLAAVHPLAAARGTEGTWSWAFTREICQMAESEPCSQHRKASNFDGSSLVKQPKRLPPRLSFPAHHTHKKTHPRHRGMTRTLLANSWQQVAIGFPRDEFRMTSPRKSKLRDKSWRKAE